MKILNEIMWFFDYNFAWMFYNGYKFHRYNKYMLKKYGQRYRDLFQNNPDSRKKSK